MGGFLVIEEHTPLPRWLGDRIGAYLPSRCRDIMLCGAKGQIALYHDITTERGREKIVLRLQEAQTRGLVCAVIGDDVRRTVGSKLKHRLSDGRILCASLRLERIVSETDCMRSRIAFVGADSMLGRAIAVYLAKRVRFLTLVGKSETALHRLARCLWQTEGIAVTVGVREADRIITIDELIQDADCLAEGRCVSSVLAECAVFASRPSHERYYHITARTLAETAELARAWGISILVKKGAGAGRIRLTNEPSVNII